MIAGLLFLAFVYFVVAQASVLRSGGQTAADAAALAAAQDARRQLRDGWREVLLEPDAWDEFLRGRGFDTGRACEKAAQYAEDNDARTSDCYGRPSGAGFEFRVRISTNDTVGKSLVPDTDRHAEATATAALEPRCSFDPPDPTPPPPTPSTPTPTGSATPEPTPTPSPEPEPITGLVCDGVEWTIDPEDPQLPGAADLFSVRLVD